MHYLFLIFSLLLPIFSFPAFASDVDKTIVEANRLELATTPTWLALLHYKKEAISRIVQSQVDGEQFFLSKTGKTDPKAELEADLRAFMRAPELNHAQCRFPARWFWLKQQLSITPSQYDVVCPKLEQWLEKTSADKLTLVFPAMYLNNPGSMFGHTFIRFDNTDKPILLSYTLNYAAKVDSGDGFMAYSYKGLSGGYNGVFGIRPYYETVQTYSNLENRDIWEYGLDYSQEEITQLRRHVWEVMDVQFDYFFLNENCAYRLLSLLDAVKAEAQLSSEDAFPVYAIPVDTVRALENKSLILSRKFRASLATQIEQNSQFLTSSLNETAIALADKNISFNEFKEHISDKEQQASVLNQTYALLQFREQDDSELATQLLSTLSTLPKSPKQDYSGIEPEKGHDSVLAAIGAGEVRDKRNIRFQIRGSFHSLLDDPTGYLAGAEITSFDTELDWLTEDEKLQLEKFTFFKIAALAPIKRWQKPISWRFNISVDRTPINTTDTTLAFITSGSAGGSVKLAEVIYFALADVEINASKRYAKGYSSLLGWSGGLVYAFGFGQLKLEYQSSDSFAGADIERVRKSAAVNFNFSRELAVQFGYEEEGFRLFEVDEWGVKVNYYF